MSPPFHFPEIEELITNLTAEVEQQELNLTLAKQLEQNLSVDAPEDECQIASLHIQLAATEKQRIERHLTEAQQRLKMVIESAEAVNAPIESFPLMQPYHRTLVAELEQCEAQLNEALRPPEGPLVEVSDEEMRFAAWSILTTLQRKQELEQQIKRSAEIGRLAMEASKEAERIFGKFGEFDTPDEFAARFNALFGVDISDYLAEAPDVLAKPQDLRIGDMDALVKIIKPAYKECGSSGQTLEDFGQEFLEMIFDEGWTSEMSGGEFPSAPGDNIKEDFSIFCGTLIENSQEYCPNPHTREYRKAGAKMWMKIYWNQTQVNFEYNNVLGHSLKPTVRDEYGSYILNIKFVDKIQRLQAGMMAEWNFAERDRFRKFNLDSFVVVARKSLYHWYRVGEPWEQVPGVDFVLLYSSRDAGSNFEILDAYQEVMKELMRRTL